MGHPTTSLRSMSRRSPAEAASPVASPGTPGTALWLAWLTSAALALLPATVLAQSAESSSGESSTEEEEERTGEAGGEAGDQPVIVPPELTQFVPATYPSEAEAARVEATVEVALTIEADGSVTEVAVVEPQGHGFDEAAVAAVQQFRFTPALRDGEPIRVRIRYRYVFELAEAALEDQPGAIEGRIIDEDETPIAGAEVVIFEAAPGEDGLRAEAGRATADAEGRFAIPQLPAGEYAVVVRAEGREGLENPELVEPAEVTDVLYRMSAVGGAAGEDEEEDLGFGATAEIDPPAREVTRRVLRATELTRIPGTRGDALRAVEILPGVGRPSFGAGNLLIRGSAPGDSQVLINDGPAPLLYHFGGLTSAINSRLLDRIDFIPGNFSVRYGRKIGGILDVSTRDPRTDGFHGVLEFGVIDASLLLEFPVHETVGVALGFRRSLVDTILPAVLPEGAFSFTSFPVYYDYQALLTWRPTDRDRLTFVFYGSSDSFLIEVDDSFGDNALLTGNAELSTRFNLFQLGYEHSFNENTELDIDIQGGPVNLSFGIGDSLGFRGDINQFTFRGEIRHRVNEYVRLIGGLDFFWAPYDFNVVGPQISQSEGDGNSGGNLTADNIVTFQESATAYRPAIYIESDLQLHEDLRVVLGARVDYDRQIEEWSFDPRVVLFIEPTDWLVLKGGAGFFSQPPEFQESADGIGNPDLEMIHAVHFSLGTELRPIEGLEITLEGFYKQLWDRVVSTPSGVAPYFDNAGIGRIYGMELSGKYDPPGRGPYGYLSYTLSRSERRDRPGDAWRLFDYDQTHILTLTALYQLPHDWEVGATFRYVTGNPATPTNGAAVDLRNNSYTPINGDINSIRVGDFHRLDLRVEKQWVFEMWKFAIFLDIQNVYNRQNPEGQSCRYDYDPSECVVLSGLPIIPALGIRGEM